jgi:hypothetical protein
MRLLGLKVNMVYRFNSDEKLNKGDIFLFNDFAFGDHGTTEGIDRDMQTALEVQHDWDLSHEDIRTYTYINGRVYAIVQENNTYHMYECLTVICNER